MGCNRGGMPVSVFRRQDFNHLRFLFLLLLIAVDPRFQLPYRRLYMHRLFEIAVNAFAVILTVAMVHLNTVHGRAAGAHGPSHKPWDSAVSHQATKSEEHTSELQSRGHLV